MKKCNVLSVLALACLSVQAVELTGVRFAGYTTTAVPAGFSILAVPFSGYDTGSFSTTNLSLGALLSTNGLAINDRLIAFDEVSTNYFYYRLDAGGWTPLSILEVGTQDSTNHVVQAPALSTLTEAQGYAFWLKTTQARTAQLQGVVNTNDTGVAIAANAFTLIGNALPDALELNSTSFTNANKWFTPYPMSDGDGPGDEIHVVNGASQAYECNVYFDGSWKKLVNGVPENPSVIPAGSGVWYLRRGTNVVFKLQ